MEKKRNNLIKYSQIRTILGKKSKGVQNKFIIRVKNEDGQDQEYMFRCETEEVL